MKLPTADPDEAPGWQERRDWEIYLGARQLWLETGDLDALANMIGHVTPRDLDIPGRVDVMAWNSPTGPAVTPAQPADLRCY